MRVRGRPEVRAWLRAVGEGDEGDAEAGEALAGHHGLRVERREAAGEAAARRSRERRSCRTTAAAALLARAETAFRYEFRVVPSFSVNDGADMRFLGSFHGAEVPFVFGDTFELKSRAERDVDDFVFAEPTCCRCSRFAHNTLAKYHASCCCVMSVYQILGSIGAPWIVFNTGLLTIAFHLFSAITNCVGVCCIQAPPKDA